jgi:Fe-S-cluster-containing dehydrogenase component
MTQEPERQGTTRQEPYAWGMVVDLDRCIGCQACVVACQAENNIPINGEQEFLDHRAKEWIRIERYWEGEFPNVKARFMPVLCQHCENAPCEPVCPVYATMRSDEGLNVQVYNRCVGTRYCANNCPYSVRYFNWGQPAWPEPLSSQLNPDVTVRSQGVMEKCTFCVQRINRARRTADRLGRPVGEDELQPACAQACPTSTLIFGNRNDPNSRVRRLADDPRRYRLLEHEGTEPAVTYLKKVDPTLAEEVAEGGARSAASGPGSGLSATGEQRRAAAARILRREAEGRWLTEV